jgi:malate synthase
VNLTPPRPQLTEPGPALSSERLATVATLARTYDAQRLRLLQRAGLNEISAPAPALRGLQILEPAVLLDGRCVSASIVDVVLLADQPVIELIQVPFLTPASDLMAAEAGWWDALFGDVERRVGAAPGTLGVALVPAAPDGVRAVFADRLVS